MKVSLQEFSKMVLVHKLLRFNVATINHGKRVEDFIVLIESWWPLLLWPLIQERCHKLLNQLSLWDCLQIVLDFLTLCKTIAIFIYLTRKQIILWSREKFIIALWRILSLLSSLLLILLIKNHRSSHHLLSFSRWGGLFLSSLLPYKLEQLQQVNNRFDARPDAQSTGHCIDDLMELASLGTCFCRGLDWVSCLCCFSGV